MTIGTAQSGLGLISLLVSEVAIANLAQLTVLKPANQPVSYVDIFMRKNVTIPDGGRGNVLSAGLTDPLPRYR